jgi:hypothetical protein
MEIFDGNAFAYMRTDVVVICVQDEIGRIELMSAELCFDLVFCARHSLRWLFGVRTVYGASRPHTYLGLCTLSLAYCRLSSPPDILLLLNSLERQAEREYWYIIR